MSEKEVKQVETKTVPITVVVEAGKLNTETLEVDIVPGMEKALAQNTLREVVMLQRKVEDLEKQIEELKKEKTH